MARGPRASAAPSHIRLLQLAGQLALVARRAAAGHACWAGNEASCLAKAGCRWFSYGKLEGCRLCKAAFGDQKAVTGCRDWDPASYCQDLIFLPAQRSYQGNPADAAFRQAVQRYRIAQGSGEPGNPHKKVAHCTVWCDYTWPYLCFGQPQTALEVRGVNYGGRFVPEHYLGTKGIKDLFEGVDFPKEVGGKPVREVSLCDVGEVKDAGERMSRFLDINIQGAHFDYIAALGFNVVRLPLGYWNLAALPGSAAPNGACGPRWRRLQAMLSPKDYFKWIELVFKYARKAKLKVMLDLHGAPGGQADNMFTGCDQGQGNYFFDTHWNRHIAVSAVEVMAKVCANHSQQCYGVELLNEPDGDIPRKHLKEFYVSAIKVARKHLGKEVPLIVMEWTDKLPWWQREQPFSYKDHGRVFFSTHVYRTGPEVTDQEEARGGFFRDLAAIRTFYQHSVYDILVSEYALSGHGPGRQRDDLFDYNSLANWYVHQFNQQGLGSIVWNFDADIAVRSWGPVAEANRLGSPHVDWGRIFGGTPLHPEIAQHHREQGGEGGAEPGILAPGHPQVVMWPAVVAMVFSIFAALAASVAALLAGYAAYRTHLLVNPDDRSRLLRA